MTTNGWTLTVDDGNVAWLTFDLPNEKVNKFTAAAISELQEVLAKQVSREAIHALVIRSGKNDNFIAGADISELAKIDDVADARAKADQGKAVFGVIAALKIPTVAAIHGACLGGGLEMTLACRYRVVTDHPKTSLGLPEVNLGIIPGWGGTQRLPRLIGLEAALKMILTGRPVDGRRAYKLGLADAIVAEPFLEDQTRRFVESVLTRQGKRDVAKHRRRRQRFMSRLLAGNPLGRWIVYRAARRQIMKRTKGHYPAPLEALEVVRRTYRREAGASVETNAFAELSVTKISRNLVWLFQASQRLRKGSAPASRHLEPVRRAGVVGAGVMGGGIAWALSRAGISVRLKDINWDALAMGTASAASACRALVKRRKMTQAEMDLTMLRIGPSLDYTGFADADVVIEAVAEDLELKKTVLAEIEAAVRPDTIIATNTSSLSLDDMSAALKHPQRFVGLHFFNPVPRMPLVEVVPGPDTSKETVVAAAELIRRLDKTPLIVGDCAGFLVNRILLPYLIESAWMFEEGNDARRIDTLLERFGMPMGPLALVDEVGLDVGYKVAKVLEDAYGDRMHVPEGLGAVAASDALGRKTGAGFYRYRKGRKKPNRKVERLAKKARVADGVEARRLTDEQIIDRAILIMVNEAARCLEEGVITDPETLDMAMVMGTGFAPFRGGLLRYADERGVKEISERLGELASQFGDRFQAAPLIVKIAGNGGRFYEDAA